MTAKKTTIRKDSSNQTPAPPAEGTPKRQAELTAEELAQASGARGNYKDFVVVKKYDKSSPVLGS